MRKKGFYIVVGFAILIGGLLPYSSTFGDLTLNETETSIITVNKIPASPAVQIEEKDKDRLLPDLAITGIIPSFPDIT